MLKKDKVDIYDNIDGFEIDSFKGLVKYLEADKHV